jgi:riboflavin synthase
MFTGLIEEIGIVQSIRQIGGGKRFRIHAQKIMDDLKIDDSVSIDGACQTVVAFGKNYFEVEAVEETLSKTTLTFFKNNDKVNLERAAKVSDRLGGHIVQGHVDCIAHVKSIEKQITGILIWIEYPIENSKFAVQHGSICINGVSLTIARERSPMLMASIIPHTWEMTNLQNLSPGSKVNLEFDILGKYIEKMLNIPKEQKKSSLSHYIDQPEF